MPEINKPTDDTLLVSRSTLARALLEALNPVQVRLTWTQMLSSSDALSDQTTTDDLLADLYQFVEAKLADVPDSQDAHLLTRIVTIRQAITRILQSKQ